MKILKEQTTKEELLEQGYVELESSTDMLDKKKKGWTVKRVGGTWYGKKSTTTKTNQTTAQPQVEEEIFNELIELNYDNYTDNEGKTYYALVVGEGDNLKSLHLYPKGKVIDKL